MVYQSRLLYHHSATKEHYKLGYTTNTASPEVTRTAADMAGREVMMKVDTVLAVD
jgi:hypothetical protein